MMKFVLSLVLFCVFVASAVAGPVSWREQCARHCTESYRFQLTPGTTYSYDYETMTTTTVKGTTQDKSQLHMTAQVDFEVLSKCELSLRLRGVSLKQSDPESPDHLNPIKRGREFARTMERHVLRFSFQDGRIEELCPAEGTPAWVTNIHRGVLSAFQNSMKDLEANERVVETDVSGKCTAEYQSLGKSWRGMLTIRKTKDLNACSDRHDVNTAFQATPYSNAALPIQGLPMVSGSQECEQNLGSGILQSSSCTETHFFRPFSKGGAGVTTSVTQKLTYSTSSKRSFTGNDYRPTRVTLLFDHDKETSDENLFESDADKTMRELCQASQRDITAAVPSKFAAFVYQLRKLTKEQLASFLRKVDEICPGNIKAKRFFLDAMPMVATPSAVYFMTELISRQEISNSEANFWFTSLSFISEPTEDMIAALTPVVDGRNEQALLGTSSLVHTFCTRSDCSRSPEARAFVHRVADFLGENCYNADTRKILLSLKSLGNIGNLFGRESVLERCYKNPQLPMEVRLSAIQAFRRIDCDVSSDSLLKSYSNYNEDSEIRIASYLAAMRCPTPETLQIVREVLENEKINQVGSFVWTHLQALSKSKHSDRQDIRNIFNNLYLLNKYHSDVRKFSSAHEASVFIESLDSGLHMDTQVIFPTHSYLPHSASVNFTVDIFGHSCNLLQLDGRLEGLENAVERFFGPSGYFPQKKVASLLRDKRSVSDNKIDEIDKMFDARGRLEEKPYGSLDVKIFGNTLWYNQFEEGKNTNIDFLNMITELAKEQEKEYTRSFMFLDSTYTIPMASGLPLRLALNGSATVGLKIGGKFNVRSFKHVDILGHIEPSGAVEIAGLLAVDVGKTTRSGLRISATVHSSTVLDGKVEVSEGRIVKAQLNVPREKIEIIDIQSKLYLVHGSEEREQSGLKEKSFHHSYCSGEVTGKVFGMEICSEVQLPSGKPHTPIYPFNGPATVSLYLRKTDSSLKSYIFDAQWENRLVKGEYIRRGFLSLNTPQSSINRDVMFEMQFSEPDRSFSFKMKTPFKKLAVNAQFLNDRSLKKLDINVNVDDGEKLFVGTELRTVVDKNGVNYAPSLEIRTQAGRIASIAGATNLKYGHKYSGYLNIQDLTQRPILLKGNFIHKNRNVYGGEFSVSSYALDATFTGQAETGDTMIIKFNTDYKLFEGRPNKISISGKIRDLSANALTKYTGVINMQISALPEWDTSVSWETMKTIGHLENTFSISLGDGQRTRVHAINIQEIVRYKGNLKNNEVAVMLKMSYPEKNINYAFEMKHENTNKNLKNIIGVTYGHNKQISTFVDVSMLTSDSFSVSGDAKIQYLGREAGISAELTETKPLNYRTALNIQWQGRQIMNAIAHYNDKSDSIQSKHEVSFEVTRLNRALITFFGSFGINRGQYSGRADLNFESEKYRLTADYTHGSNFNHHLSSELLWNNDIYSARTSLQSLRDKYTTAVDVKLPGHKHITFKGDLKYGKSFKFSSIDVMWDADRDPTKRFGAEVELRTKNSGYECKFTAQIKKRTIKGFLLTSVENRLQNGIFKSAHKAEIEWSPTDKAKFFVTSNIVSEATRQQYYTNAEISTPFKSYEKLGLSVNHENVNKQWNSEITAIWSKNKRILLSSQGKYSLMDRNGNFLDVNFKMQSPFSQLETLDFNMTHSHDTYALSNKIIIIRNTNQKITSDIFGSTETTGFQGGIKITTPFTNYEYISVEHSHSLSSGNVKSKSELRWAPNRKIEAILEGAHSVNGRRRTCSISLMAMSTFKGYEGLSSKLVYSNDGTDLSADIETLWKKQKITLGVTGINRSSYYNKNIEGKAYFTSHFRGYERLELISTLQAASGSYKTSINAQLPYDRAISFSSQCLISTSRDIELNIAYSGDIQDYIGFKSASLEFTHKLQESNLRSKLDVAYDNKQILMYLNGMYKSGYKSHDLESSLLIATPIPSYSEVKLDITHTKRDREFATRMQISKNRDNFLLVHNINVKDQLNFEMSVHQTTSFFKLRDVKALISMAYDADQLINNMNIQWNQNRPIDLSISYTNKYIVKEFDAQFSSPFKSMENIRINSIYKKVRGEYELKLMTEINRSKKFSIETNFRNHKMQQGDAKILFTSNFPDHEFYQFIGKYDAKSPRKTIEITFSSNKGNSKSISITGNGIFDRHTNRIDINVETPFEGFQEVSLISECVVKPTEKSLLLVYGRDRNQIAINAKSTTDRNGAVYEVTFNGPTENVKRISFVSKYKRDDNNILIGEVSAQWISDKTMSLNAEFTKFPNANVNFKADLQLPFRNYENVKLEALSDISNSQTRKAKVNISYGKNNQVELLATCKTIASREGQFSVEFRSPFKSFEKVTLNSGYKTRGSEYEGEIKIEVGDKDVYKCRAKYGPDYDFALYLDTPHKPIKNVELTGSFKSHPGHHELNANLKWETKKASIIASYKYIQSNSVLMMLKINTPFQSFKELEAESSINNSPSAVNIRASIVTPLEILKNLQFTGQFEKEKGIYEGMMEASSVSKTLRISGQIINKRNNAYEASLDVNTPFKSLQTFAAKTKLVYNGLKNSQVEIVYTSPSHVSSFTTSVSYDNGVFLYDFKVDSPILNSRTSSFRVKVDYRTPEVFDALVIAKIGTKTHSASANLRRLTRDVECLMKISSPLLPGQTADFKATYSARRQNSHLSGKIVLMVQSAEHQMEYKYEKDRRKTSGGFSISSNLLPDSKLNGEATYINSNGRDIELALTVFSPKSKHSVIGSLKNYKEEKFVQIKIECPLLESNELSITGTLKNSNWDAVDAVLTISSSSSKEEFRVAGNMKKNRWDSIEAFLTLNTPYEALRMLRIDGRFNNDHFRNIDCNVQLETSNERLPSLGFTGKLSRTEGSEDLSLMLHLPNSNYRTIQVLGNVHYNKAKTVADSRITLSLPPKRFSVYGQYMLNNDGLSTNAEFEWNANKWTTFGNIQGRKNAKGISASLALPDKRSYAIGAYFTSTNKRHSVAVSYNNPRNRALNLNATLDFISLNNFDSILKITAPFMEYRNIDARIRYRYNDLNFFSVDSECIINQHRTFANIMHKSDRATTSSSFNLGTPLEWLQDVDASYTKNDYEKRSTFDLTHNKLKVMKAEVVVFEKELVYLLDIPVFPFTVTAKRKCSTSGQELIIQTKCPTRSTLLTSFYQDSAEAFVHKAMFSWDEKRRKQISYDVTITGTSRGQSVGKELYCRINFPVRSVELKGKITNSNRVRSVGGEIYWDANGDRQKHFVVGAELQNHGTQDKIAYKVQITISHPRLSKELVQTCSFNVGNREFHVRSELQYSRYPEHHLNLELRGDALSREHYKAEMTLKHPATYLDLKAVGEVSNSPQEAAVRVRVSNVDRRRLLRMQEVKGKIIKSRNQIDFIMRSDKSQFSLMGRVLPRNDDLTITVEQKLNEQEISQSRLQLRKKERALEMNITTSEKNGVYFNAAFPDESASLKFGHYANDVFTNDASFCFGLEKSQIIQSYIRWRPEVWKDMRIRTGEILRNMIQSTRSNLQGMVTTLSEERRYKMFHISQAMHEQLSPFLKEMKKDMSELADDVATLRKTFSEMYENNEFYAKDIAQGMKKACRVFSDFCGKVKLLNDVLFNIIAEYIDELYYTLYYAWEDFITATKAYLSQLYSTLQKLLANVGTHICNGWKFTVGKTANFLRRFGEHLLQMNDYIMQKVELWLRSYAPYIIDSYYYIKMTADRIRETIHGTAQSISRAITTNPLYIAVNKYLDMILTTINAFRQMDIVDTVQSRILMLSETANLVVNKVSNVDLLGTINKHIPLRYVAEVAKTSLQKSVALYSALRVDDALKSIFNTALYYAKEMVLSSGREMLQEFYHLKGSLKYDFEPEKGNIYLEYNLPVPRKTLLEVIDFESYPEYQKLNEMKKDFIFKYYEDFCVWDIYYKFKKYLSPQYWMPPFTAYAMVAGNQHYVTFDKTVFDFAGECSYLLARDFIDGNFTLIVNYGRSGQRVIRKSITLLTESKKINVGHDYKVTMDDVKVELPLQIGNTVITREGSHIQMQNIRKGFLVECNFVYDICTATMSGFYFGKTGGLFGTYDNEPQLDFLTPERMLASDVESFVNSWEVGHGSCRKTENMATRAGNDYRVQRKCEELFATSASDFRLCYKQVNPEPYLNMCISDLSAVHEQEFDTTICTSAAAYFTQCKAEGVPLKMPKSCVRCNTQDMTAMTEGDVMKFTRNDPSYIADVVFVVEEKQCNGENFKMLGKLAHTINENFLEKKFRDIRYSVVGFGGSGVHAKPHVHTLDGQISGSIRSIESAFRSLEVGDGPVNVLEALRYAASLPLRPGSSKSFILVKCSTCRAEEVKAEYSEMLRTLLDGDISLHLLMEQRYEMKTANKNAKAKKVIGLDKKFAYTLKDVKATNLLGDGDLLAQIKIPKDVCIPLALEVNGSTFDLQYLTEMRKNTYKKFMDVLARRMVRSAQERAEWDMCCECIATSDGVGKSTCQRCVSSELSTVLAPDILSVPTAKSDEEVSKPRIRRQREKKRRN